VRLDKTTFDISPVIGKAKESRRLYDEERAQKRLLQIEKYSGETNISAILENNPQWKYVFDRALLSLTNPVDVIYQYELESGGDVRLINGWSDNPRIKVHGHEYAIWLPADSNEYIIRDFVSEESTNLIGYLKHKFPELDEFGRYVKLKKDFPNVFVEKIIYENPHYYISEYANILKSEEIKSEEDILRALTDKKIAKAIVIKPDCVLVQKNNDFVLKFDINDAGSSTAIRPTACSLVEYCGAIASYSQRVSSPKCFSLSDKEGQNICIKVK
jgi:hypothetical protein